MTGRQCGVSNQGYICTSFDISNVDIDIVATIYETGLTLDNLPDLFFLAFTYYVLHRYYMQTDADKSSYYYTLHQREWGKVHRPQLCQYQTGLGSDL